MKLAILGTGLIVKEGALPALRQVPEIEVVAIFARPASREKAEKLQHGYSIPKVYTDYDELLADPEIDFVYVGLVNSVHYEYTKKALLAGKHVIVEKPFASAAREVQELRQLAIDRGLYVFEAVTLLYLPNFAAIREALPQLGKIKAVMANYSQYSSRYDRYLQGEVLPAFDPERSGGALYDINIYNLNLIIGLFGAPKAVQYTANIGFNGIDTSGVVQLQYPDFFALAMGAKDSDSPGYAVIQGEKGYIRMEGNPNELRAFELKLRGSGVKHHYELNRYSHRMVHEFQEFAKIFAAKDYDRVKEGLEVSAAVLETAETARKQAGIVFPIDGESV
ncbi:Predicted dehydrogenase [Selenomonas sp. WCT3]|uniref:Gfo/Idh/MocA family protein n=1 Tax=Selenomonas sp. WCT3 TaxID=3158785 RepID=UPI000882F68F|nr:Predicted dehydrogenase [Selenomonas ruminantium]